MLLKQATLEAIANGKIDTVFRRWKTTRVKAGSTFKTSVGVLEVVRIQPTSLQSIDDRWARRAGYPSRKALLDELARHKEGRLYRIALRVAGPDPRRKLCGSDKLTAAERVELEDKVGRLGARSAHGAWGFAILRLIATRPAIRAGDLAGQVGMERARFKARVRQLKELGLTESLEVGYRLSARGRAFLANFKKETGCRNG